MGIITGDLGAFREVDYTASMASLIIGIPGLYFTVRGVYGSGIERAVENALNCMRVWRSLVNYREPVFEAELKRPSRPWIADYLAEALGFARLLRDCEPSVFEFLVMSIHELYGA